MALRLYDWALRRVFLFTLRRALGEALEDLDVNQLDVALREGTLEIRNACVSAAYLTSKLGNAVPVTCKAGRVGSLRASIPWHALGKEPIHVELIEVDLVLAPGEGSFGKGNVDEDNKKTNYENSNSKTTPQIKNILTDTWRVLRDTFADVFTGMTVTANDVAIRLETNTADCSDCDDSDENANALLRFDEITFGDETSDGSVTNQSERTKVLSVTGATVEMLVMSAGNTSREWRVVVDGESLDGDVPTSSQSESGSGINFVAASKTLWLSADAFLLGEVPKEIAYSLSVSSMVSITADPEILKSFVEVADAFGAGKQSDTRQTTETETPSSDLFSEIDSIETETDAPEPFATSAEDRKAFGEVLAATKEAAEQARERLTSSKVEHEDEDVFFDAEDNVKESRGKTMSDVSVTVDVPVVTAFLAWDSTENLDDETNCSHGIEMNIRSTKLTTSTTHSGSSVTLSIGSVAAYEMTATSKDTSLLTTLPESCVFGETNCAYGKNQHVLFSTNQEIHASLCIPNDTTQFSQLVSSASIKCSGAIFARIDSTVAGKAAALIFPLFQGGESILDYDACVLSDRPWHLAFDAPQVRVAVVVVETEKSKNAAAVDFFAVALEATADDDGLANVVDAAFDSVDAYMCIDTVDTEKPTWLQVMSLKSQNENNKVTLCVSSNDPTKSVPLGANRDDDTNYPYEGDLARRALECVRRARRVDTDSVVDESTSQELYEQLVSSAVAAASLDVRVECGDCFCAVSSDVTASVTNFTEALALLSEWHPMRLTPPPPDTKVPPVTVSARIEGTTVISFEKSEKSETDLDSVFASAHGTSFFDAVEVMYSSDTPVKSAPQVQLNKTEITYAQSLGGTQNADYVSVKSVGGSLRGANQKNASLFVENNKDASSGGSRQLVSLRYARVPDTVDGNGKIVTSGEHGVSVFVQGAEAFISETSRAVDGDKNKRDLRDAINDVAEAFRVSDSNTSKRVEPSELVHGFFSCFDLWNASVAFGGYEQSYSSQLDSGQSETKPSSQKSLGILRVDHVLLATEKSKESVASIIHSIPSFKSSSCDDPVASVTSCRISGVSLHVAQPSSMSIQSKIHASEYARVASEERVAVDVLTTTSGKSRIGVRFASMKYEARSDAFDAATKLVEKVVGWMNDDNSENETVCHTNGNEKVAKNYLSDDAPPASNINSHISPNAFSVDAPSMGKHFTVVPESVVCGQLNTVLTDFYTAPSRMRKTRRRSPRAMENRPVAIVGGVRFKPPRVPVVESVVQFATPSVVQSTVRDSITLRSSLRGSEFSSLHSGLGASVFVDTAETGVGHLTHATGRWFDGTAPTSIGELKISSDADFSLVANESTKDTLQVASGGSDGHDVFRDFGIPLVDKSDNNSTPDSVITVHVAQIKAVLRPGVEWRSLCSSKSGANMFACDGVRVVLQDFSTRVDTFQEMSTSHTTRTVRARLGDAAVFSRSGAQNSSKTTLFAYDSNYDRETKKGKKHALLKVELTEEQSDSTELTLRVKVLPLRLRLDRVALDFLGEYFGSDTCVRGDNPRDNDENENTRATTTHYFRVVDIRLATLRVDHAVRDVDVRTLQEKLSDKRGWNGVLRECSNLLPLKGVVLDFSNCDGLRVLGVKGDFWNVFGTFVSMLLDHITNTQTDKFMEGLGAVKSVKKVSEGAVAFAKGAACAAEYFSSAALTKTGSGFNRPRKSSNEIWRASVSGVAQFARVLSTEALGFAANVTGSATRALENADDALVDGFSISKNSHSKENKNDQVRSPSVRVQTKAAGRASDAAAHPIDVKEGASRAVASLKRGLSLGIATARDGPARVHREGKSGVAVLASAAFAGTSAAVTSTASVARAARDVARGAKRTLEKQGGLGSYRGSQRLLERGDGDKTHLASLAFVSDEEWDGASWDTDSDDDTVA